MAARNPRLILNALLPRIATCIVENLSATPPSPISVMTANLDANHKAWKGNLQPLPNTHWGDESPVSSNSLSLSKSPTLGNHSASHGSSNVNWLASMTTLATCVQAPPSRSTTALCVGAYAWDFNRFTPNEPKSAANSTSNYPPPSVIVLFWVSRQTNHLCPMSGLPTHLVLWT